mmetsp:Transcript_101506/g.293746  ORF Transcript_101506/g.293746 Transcript_101506/m.293746 type:complete len:719 (-) Transcript_101506:129-2285(-)
MARPALTAPFHPGHMAWPAATALLALAMMYGGDVGVARDAAVSAATSPPRRLGQVQEGAEQDLGEHVGKADHAKHEFEHAAGAHEEHEQHHPGATVAQGASGLHDHGLDEHEAAGHSEHERDEHEEAGHSEHAHNEHGEGGHAGHEHHEVSNTMLTSSYLLIGWLITNFVMLSLLNYRDEHVRSNAWKMVSSTISIYLAVVLDAAWSSWLLGGVRICFNQIWPDQNFDIAKSLTLTIMFIVWIGLVNLGCYYCREKKYHMYCMSIGEIGGHITAFAGINAVESSLSKLQEHDSTIWFIAVASFVALMLVRVASDKVRSRFPSEVIELDGEHNAPSALRSTLNSVSTRVNSTNSGTAERIEVEPKWVETACEAEDEAACIVSSFLIKVLVVTTLFSDTDAEVDGKETSWTDIWVTAGAVGACVLAVIATTYVIKGCSQLQGARHPMWKRAVESVRLTIAMSTSWLYLRLFLGISVKCFPVSKHFGEVISAGMLTGWAIIVILALDMVADKIVEGEPPNNNNNVDGLGSQSHSLPAGSEGVPEDRMTLIRSSHRLDQSIAQATELLSDTKNLEKAVRSIILSVSLSVGLAWEHAFHAATATIIETNPYLACLKKWSKTFIAAASFLLMLPVWWKFIAPKAKQSIGAFKKEVADERKAEAEADKVKAGEVKAEEGKSPSRLASEGGNPPSRSADGGGDSLSRSAAKWFGGMFGRQAASTPP